MTATNIAQNSPERLQRILTLWEHRSDLKYADVAEMVDVEMAVEAEAQAAAETRSREMTDSFTQMTVCPACGTGNTLGNRDGLCDPCGLTASVIRAELTAAQTVNGRSRRQLVETWIDRRGT